MSKRCNNQQMSQLSDLPPKLIVDEILTFFYLIIPFTNMTPYDLFGYFKKDEKRNIWFIFSSLGILSDNGRNNIPQRDFNASLVRNIHRKILISFPRLVYLGVSNPTSLFLRYLRNHSPSMTLLTGLTLKDPTENSKPIFHKNGSSFPSLKRLKVGSCGSHFGKTIQIISNWGDIVNDKPVSNLQQLDLFMCSVDKKLYECIMSTDRLWNLLVLKLYSFSFLTKKIVYIPLLRILSLRDCENLCVLTGKDLRELDLDWTKLDDLEDFFTNKESFGKLITLKLIHFIKDGNVPQWFLDLDFHTTFPKLQMMEISTPFTPFSNYPKLIEIAKSVCTNSSSLKRLKLGTSKDDPAKNLDVFGWNFDEKELESLSLDRIPVFSSQGDFTSLSSSLAENLKCLVFQQVSNIGDNFFQLNRFPKLEKLELESPSESNWQPNAFNPLTSFYDYSSRKSGFLKGLNWNHLPSLKTLILKKYEDISDTIFQNLLFPQLQNLELVGISDNNQLKGVNWNPTLLAKLRTVRIIESSGRFCDNLFRNNEFSGLEELTLKENSTTTGLHWKDTKNLRVVFITSQISYIHLPGRSSNSDKSITDRFRSKGIRVSWDFDKEIL